MSEIRFYVLGNPANSSSTIDKRIDSINLWVDKQNTLEEMVEALEEQRNWLTVDEKKEQIVIRWRDQVLHRKHIVKFILEIINLLKRLDQTKKSEEVIKLLATQVKSFESILTKYTTYCGKYVRRLEAEYEEEIKQYSADLKKFKNELKKSEDSHIIKKEAIKSSQAPCFAGTNSGSEIENRQIMEQEQQFDNLSDIDVCIEERENLAKDKPAKTKTMPTTLVPMKMEMESEVPVRTPCPNNSISYTYNVCPQFESRQGLGQFIMLYVPDEIRKVESASIQINVTFTNLLTNKVNIANNIDVREDAYSIPRLASPKLNTSVSKIKLESTAMMSSSNDEYNFCRIGKKKREIITRLQVESEKGTSIWNYASNNVHNFIKEHSNKIEHFASKDSLYKSIIKMFSATPVSQWLKLTTPREERLCYLEMYLLQFQRILKIGRSSHPEIEKIKYLYANKALNYVDNISQEDAGYILERIDDILRCRAGKEHEVITRFQMQNKKRKLSQDEKTVNSAGNMQTIKRKKVDMGQEMQIVLDHKGSNVDSSEILVAYPMKGNKFSLFSQSSNENRNKSNSIYATEDIPNKKRKILSDSLDNNGTIAMA